MVKAVHLNDDILGAQRCAHMFWGCVGACPLDICNNMVDEVPVLCARQAENVANRKNSLENT